MRIYKENCMGVLIDVQEKLFPHMHDHEELKQRIIKLTKGLKLIKTPLLVTQQYTKGLGDTLPELKEALGGHNYTEKMAFSCCGEPSFLQIIKSHLRQFIIIYGIEAHVCVLQTALDLIEHGFIPVVIQDCVSSRDSKQIDIAMQRIRHEGGIVSTYESILFELLHNAEAKEFKDISKLVK